MGGRIIALASSRPTRPPTGSPPRPAACSRPSTTASPSSTSSTAKAPSRSATSASPRRTATIVWVGTGENNPRNSVSYGDGVYKSTDGGKTWKNMGLRESFQIGRIVIHPKDPNIVYVGALGRLYGPNEERGLFKTTDGGKTGSESSIVDDKTGFIDMRMNPADPDTLLVATWERKRDEFDSFLGDARPTDGSDGYDPTVNHSKGRRRLPDHRRRQDLEEARQGPADGRDRPHRPRLVPQGPEDRLRHHRHGEDRHRRCRRRRKPYLGVPGRGGQPAGASR